MASFGLSQLSIVAVALTLGCGSEDSEPPPPPPIGTTANGDLCSLNSDCSSGDCSTNGTGEHRCYGTGVANASCGDTYDCNSGLCIDPHYLTNSQDVCVPSWNYCRTTLNLSSDCTNAAVLNAQRWNDCGRMTVTFDACVKGVCDRIKSNAENCATLHYNLTAPGATCVRACFRDPRNPHAILKHDSGPIGCSWGMQLPTPAPIRGFRGKNRAAPASRGATQGTFRSPRGESVRDAERREERGAVRAPLS